MLCATSSDLPVLLVSIVLLDSSQLANRVVEYEQKKQWLVRHTHIHLTSSTRMNNTKCFIHHLVSSYISSLREVAPLSPREISASVSLLDSEWQNLRVSIVLESILSSKGQFASSKLNISRDTWPTHKSTVIIEVQGKRISAYSKGINEV